MKPLIPLLFVCLLSVAAATVEAPDPAPVFQMRPVAEAPSKDSEAMVVVDQQKDASRQEKLQVLKTVLLDQADLKSARVTKDNQLGRPQIEIKFTDKGKQRFARVTRENIGRRLAVIIDGRLYSAPRIMAEIPGGTGVIAGNFSEPDARELVSRITQALQKK